MRQMTLVLAFMGTLPLALSAEVTKEDLKRLASAGISDGVILSYVKMNGPVAKLSPEDVIELKNAGLKESLLAQLLSVPAPAASASRPSATAIPETSAPYGTSPPIVYEDVYPGYYYTDWAYPWWGLGVGVYAGRYCYRYPCWNRYPYWTGYYGNRYAWNGYRSGPFIRGYSAVGTHHAGQGGVRGGTFGAGHAGGGGHGGHR